MLKQEPLCGEVRCLYDKLIEGGPARCIELLIHCPISVGYFFKFCKSEFCSETINFIVEVDNYMDLFIADENGWDQQKSWKEIDLQLNSHEESLASTDTPEVAQEMTHAEITESLKSDEFIPSATWPHTKVDRLTVLDSVRAIWNRFLADSAQEQICLPANVMKNTCRRLLRVDLYGKELFQEACRDRTILNTQRDIATRFEKTEDFQTCLKRLEELMKPTCAVTIHIPAPRCALTISHTKNQLLEAEREVLFTLEETLKDGFLYTEFMKYLNHCMASEHLRFVRAVYIFRKMLVCPDPAVQKKASDWAFKLYQNFVVPGAPYEICCPAATRRDIGRHIATPQMAMFKTPEREALTMLGGLFEAYQKTPEYAHLRIKIAENFDALQACAPSANSISANTVNSNSKLSVASRLLIQRQSSSNSHHSLNSTGKGGLPPVHSPVMSRCGSHQGMPKPTVLLSIAPIAPSSSSSSSSACAALGSGFVLHTPTSGGTIGTAASRSQHIDPHRAALTNNSSSGGGTAVTPSSSSSAAAAAGIAVAGGGNTGTVLRISPLPHIKTGTIAEDPSSGDRDSDLHDSNKHAPSAGTGAGAGAGVSVGVKSGGFTFLQLPVIRWFGGPR